jgi:hypothetical protein
VMTKTTLKALWLGGGGLLATWLAVAPNQHVRPSAPTSIQRSAAVNEPSADDLLTQAARLRERIKAVTPRASTRNPFRFNGSKVAASRVPPTPPPPVELAPVDVALPPSLTLNGVTGKQTSEGVRRTAVISGGGQMYFVSEGDSVAGRYTVVKIDPEAVVLRDPNGAEVRLSLQ